MKKQLSLTICGRDEVQQLLDERRFDALVTIGLQESWKNTPPFVLRLDFSDQTPWEPDAKNLAASDTVFSLVRFAGQLPESASVLIHCGAGCCRSTASAMVLLVAAGWHDYQAVYEVRKIKQQRNCIPNGWLLKLADAMLDTNLFATCRATGQTKWMPPPISMESDQ